MPLVRYGAEIVLRHRATRLFLSSPGKPYTHPGSSRQDQVTCSAQLGPVATWIVKPPHGYPEDYLYGEPVKTGATLRLENRASQKNLHSHGNRSPITSQGEVTCYGLREQGDVNDNWRIEFAGDKCLETDFPFKLIHISTNGALHSHDNSHPQFTSGQQEVTSYRLRDDNDFWTVEAVHGPLLPFRLNLGDHPRPWISALNLAGSIASVTGITLLFLGTKLSTVSLARVVSATLTSSLLLGTTTAMFLGLREGHRRLRLRAWSVPWVAVMWMVLAPIGAAIALYLWQLLAIFGADGIEPLLEELFTRK